jgi:methylmalonyl-CoA carboxyltransferase large subunit
VKIADAENNTRVTTMAKSDSDSVSNELRATLQDAMAQLANLAERVAGLEQLASMDGGESAPTAIRTEVRASVPALPQTTSSVAVDAGISEEELLAISAAIAAWLGVHAHIRQIRLIRTGAWAQQGRATIQASHRLNH